MLMRSWGVVLAAVMLAPGSGRESTQFFRYYRSVGAAPAGQVCATLDAAVYPHAAPALKDVRLFARGASGLTEAPYVLTLNEPQPVASETARVLNVETSVGPRDNRTVFDLAMPQRAYTDVTLELEGKDFIGTVDVSGVTRAGGARVRLGEFSVFDLSSQRLARSTTLHLQESTFPLLHVTLRTGPASGFGEAPAVTVKGATVPPSREGQTLYTVAASTAEIVETGGESGGASVARFNLPARVPVERIRVVLDEGFHGNFSRAVRVTSHTMGASAAETERAEGTIERTRMVRDGVELEDETLSVAATLGANLQSAAEVAVAVENGDQAPLPVHAVLLEMRRRSLCFAAAQGAPVELFYGDAGLSGPAYGNVPLPGAGVRVSTVALGPEERNPGFRERPDTRAFLERHPHGPYYALLGMVCLFALLAFGSGKVQHHRR